MAEEETKEKFGVLGCIMYALIFVFVLIGVTFLLGYTIMAKGGVTSFNHSGGHIHGMANYGDDLDHYNLSDDAERSELEEGDLILQEGQEVMLTVDENPTTGYKWNEGKSDCSHVLSITSEFDPPSNDDGRVGVPGKRTWTIDAIEKGECTLRFELRRARDRGQHADLIEIDVTVEKQGP